MSARMSGSAGQQKGPPRRAAAPVVRRSDRVGSVVRSSAVIGSHAASPPFQSSPGATGGNSGGVRAGTAVSAVSPCVVVLLGEPAIALLVPTPVGRRAVRQRDLAVGALGCFRGSRGRDCGCVWISFPSVRGMPQIRQETALGRVFVTLKWNYLLTRKRRCVEPF